jgi:hypothetical protein
MQIEFLITQYNMLHICSKLNFRKVTIAINKHLGCNFVNEINNKYYD